MKCYKLKINSSSGKKKKINSHRIKRNLHWMFKITNKWRVPNNFGVMSIERQGNQGSTSPDTMCVVPYIAFCVQCLLLYQDSVQFIMILMTPEPCSAHQYLHATWSTVSDLFHTFSFTMQSHYQY